MELSFLDLKEREIINVFDGKKLGRIIDIVFNNETGLVRGIVVPGDKKMFHRTDDVFIPIEKIKRIGNDVILVGIQREDPFSHSKQKKDYDKNIKIYENYYNRYNSRYDYGEQYQKFGTYSRQPEPVKNSQVLENNFSNSEKQKNIQTNGLSYVRLKPLERKKYK